MTPGWLIVILGYADWVGSHSLPRLAWPWLIAGWLVFLSAPGRVLLVAGTRRLLLGRLRPGRYPRRSWLATRVWFVDRLADRMHVAQYGGTPGGPVVGKLIGGRVGAGARVGQRWAGSPARPVGPAGAGWPAADAPRSSHPRLLALLYSVSVTVAEFLPMAALIPGLVLIGSVGSDWSGIGAAALSTLQWVPLAAAMFVFTYALLAALLVRWLGRWMRPGWHAGGGLTGWAAWTREEILTGTRSVLFPLYSSLYTRPWLRLMGLSVGRRSEMSTAIGLSPLVRFGSTNFVADDVVFNTGRSHRGWLHLAPVTVGDEVFLGNGAVINGATRLGDGSLVGVQSTPPADAPAATSWFGAPALQFPRTADRVDPRRTVSRAPRLVAARAAAELVRIIGPIALSLI